MKLPRIKPVSPRAARNLAAAVSLLMITAGIAGFDWRAALILVGGLVFFLTIRGMRHA